MLGKKISPFLVLIGFVGCSVSILLALAGRAWWDVAIAITAIFCIVVVVPPFVLFRKGDASAASQLLNKEDVMLGALILLLSIFSWSEMYRDSWFITGVPVIMAILPVMVVPIFIPFGKGETPVIPRSLNKKEVLLGVLILLLSIFSVNTLHMSVVPSIQYPGYYTHSDVWDVWGEPSLTLIFFLGWVAIFHGGYRLNFPEFVLGMSIAWWGFWIWLGVAVSTGYDPFIKGSVADYLNRCTVAMVPDAILGLALALNGLRKRKT